MSTGSQALKHREAQQRFELLTVEEYDIRLDLDAGDKTFGSLTTVRFTSQGGRTFIDLKPVAVNSLRFNGEILDPETLDRGRLPLETVAGANELVVDAVMPFRNDGEGLHRSTDPADGRPYVYGMSFMDAAPTVFACFDQPDLKASYTLNVRAPQEWTVVANSPGTQVEPGVWQFDTSQPLSTYFFTLIAGPYHLIRDEHDGIPLGLSVRRSLAAELDQQASELFTITKQCFDEFHRLFGIRYPFGDYHQAFVPEFNAGAMENPGCITFRDTYIFDSKVVRGMQVARATTMAHEMAHQWFGNITTPKWWDDLWLNESFAEYMGNRVTAAVTEYDDAWLYNSYARRQWGLAADQRPSTHPVAGNGADDALVALQNFDGISYAKGSAVLKQLNARIGDDVFLAGAVDHFTRHRFGNATMHDLFGSWERAGAGDLSSFIDAWLRTQGVDTLQPTADAITRTSPDGRDERSHVFRILAARDAGAKGAVWEEQTVELAARQVPLDGPAQGVLVDPFEDTWSVNLLDERSARALPALFGTIADPMARSGAWNSLRSSYHNIALSPAQALDIVLGGVASEPTDAAISVHLPWSLTSVVALTADPSAATQAIHEATYAGATDAVAGSALQLAHFQVATATCSEPAQLRAWLQGDELPAGVMLDQDLRWAQRVQLAVLGEISVEELDQAVADEPSTKAKVEYARARASRPSPEAKQWAWQHFTGEIAASNYELEAAGLGMWRYGHQELTAPYVDQFLDVAPRAPEHHRGWVLATAVASFFPRTSVDPELAARLRTLVADDALDRTVRRTLVDWLDALERRIAVNQKFGSRDE